MCRLVTRNILTMACQSSRHFGTSRSRLSTRRFLIVGLGNFDFPHTRHSIGMTVVDHMARQLDTMWLKNRSVDGMVSQATIPSADGEDELELVLLKSRLPMNVNGRSVRKAVETFGIADSDIYLVHDELDKPVGKWGMKEGGSARGHNGVKSVIEHLNTSDIPRLRVGIDRPTSKSAVGSYVLSKFTQEERTVLQSGAIQDAVRTLLKYMEKHAAVKFSKELLNEPKATKRSKS